MGGGVGVVVVGGGGPSGAAGVLVRRKRGGVVGAQSSRFGDDFGQVCAFDRQLSGSLVRVTARRQLRWRQPPAARAPEDDAVMHKGIEFFSPSFFLFSSFL